MSVSDHYSNVIINAMASQITDVSIVCSTVCSGADQIKHQSFASLAFVRGIPRWPVVSSNKGLVTRKMFPFDDVIMLHNTQTRSREFFHLENIVFRPNKCLAICYHNRAAVLPTCKQCCSVFMITLFLSRVNRRTERYILHKFAICQLSRHYLIKPKQSIMLVKC